MFPQPRFNLSGRRPSVEPDKPANAIGAVANLWKLYADVWDCDMHRNPIGATMVGDYRFNDMLMDLSEEAHEEYIQRYEEFRQRLAEINIDDLDSAVERDNYNYLKELLDIDIEAQQNMNIHEIPGHHVFGPHLGICLAANLHPWRTEEDAQTFVARVRAFSKQTDQMIAAFRKGTQTKRTLPLESVDALIAIYKGSIVDNPEDSAVYKGAIAQFTKVGGDPAELRAAVAEGVVDSFRRLAELMEKEYRDHVRPAAGVWCIPDGDKLYSSAIRYFTSMPLTAEELHELGLAEVERISKKMDAVRERVGGHTKSVAEFVEYVKTSMPQWYPKSGEEIIASYQAVLDDADKVLPDFFARLPKAEMDIKAIEEYRQASAPPAHYYPAPEDRSRNAVFYANVFKPESRPLYANAAIALHEGNPGHHMQIALAQEITGLPRLRKNAQGFTIGYTEGWGLYSEYLGEVMGDFYKDPMVYFGRLMAEIWRACRLVVDTGMHHYQWTRDQACDYLRANAGLAEQDVQTEITRYMVMPGQALAYKVGELEILRLKDQAQKELGDKFSWKDFHSVVLDSGAVPLLVLRGNAEAWIERAKAAHA